MKIGKLIIEFYINSSIHVALSVFAFIHLTQTLFTISNDFVTSKFAFFGTIVGYNFVKYFSLIQTKKVLIRIQLLAIIFLSFISLILSGFYFFQLKMSSQIVCFLFLILTILYAVPFVSNYKNIRNWAGIKIYIVAFCWLGVTFFLPIINSKIPFSTCVILFALQQLILVFVLLLIFEIIDLKLDDPNLKTVPQHIGVENTKKIGFLLMFFFVIIEISFSNFKIEFFLLKLTLAITTILLLFFANENRSRFYASFWVESIPIFWWLVVLVVEL